MIRLFLEKRVAKGSGYTTTGLILLWTTGLIFSLVFPIVRLFKGKPKDPWGDSR